MKTIEVSIIVPTYNERENIRLLIQKIHKALNAHSHEIIVVDDNSPDGTWRVAQQSKLSCVHVVRRCSGRGLVSSLQDGIIRSSGTWVGWMDADFSHPPELLTKMLRLRKKCDVVIASRYIAGSQDRRKEKVNVVGSRIINFLSKKLINEKMSDCTSGFLLIKKQLFISYRLEGRYGEYGIYLAHYLKKIQAVIHEISYRMESRRFGISKTSPSFWVYLIHSLTYLITIARLAL